MLPHSRPPSLPYKGSRQVPVWPHQDLLPGRPGGLPREASGRQVPGSHHHDPEDGPGLAAEGEIPQAEGGCLNSAEVLPRTPGPQVSQAGAHSRCRGVDLAGWPLSAYSGSVCTPAFSQELGICPRALLTCRSKSSSKSLDAPSLPPSCQH